MRACFSKSVRGWLWPILLAIVISVASGRSEIAAPGLFQFDKLGHFAVFALLATLIVRLGVNGRSALISVCVVSLYGLADEWHQSFTPGRAVEFADWVADTLGAAIATALYVYWPRYRALLETPLGRKRRVEIPGPVAPVSAR